MTTAYTVSTAPGALPLLGHGLQLARDPYAFLEKLSTCGDLVRVQLGPQQAYGVFHPDLVRRFLLEDRVFDKGGPVYDGLRETVGNGVLTCPASQHRRQRRLVQPAFHRDRMRGYTEVAGEQTVRLTAAWRHDQILDVNSAMYQLSTAVMADCLFAAPDGTPGLHRLPGSVVAFTRGMGRRVMIPVKMLDRIPTPGNRRYDRAGAHLSDLSRTLIAARRSDTTDRGDLLSKILAAREDDGTGLSDAEAHHQILNFLFAGVEALAGNLTWACYALAGHPELREQLHTEVDTVLAGRTAEYEDLPMLDVTGRIITETLRLYPPNWIITRTVATDTELGAFPLPAGTTLFYSPYQMHRRPDLFEDPTRFDPTRWQRPRKPVPGTLVAFGGGARTCIGEGLAHAVTTTALATIAARWQLDALPGHRIRPARNNITVTPRHLRMRLNRRQHTNY